MFQVTNLETGERQCLCAAYSKAFDIAQALRVRSDSTEHFAIKYGDEILFDTRNGSTS